MSTLSQFFGGTVPLTANQRPLELLIVGGGNGCNGSIGSRSGGGAGQVIWYQQYVVNTGTTYTITIGGGGISAGSTSSFGSIVAYGGSAGGSASTNAVGGFTPAAISPSIVEQAYMRLANGCLGSSSTPSSGGGGAGGPGGPGFAVSTSTYGGSGGNGAVFEITGTRTAYAGGGGGTGSTAVGSGGEGGGANGSGSTGLNGGTNTGGGGGGTSGTSTGGSGIIILAYPNTYAVPTTITGTYTEPTRAGFRVYSFTGSGTILF